MSKIRNIMTTVRLYHVLEDGIMSLLRSNGAYYVLATSVLGCHCFHISVK